MSKFKLPGTVHGGGLRCVLPKHSLVQISLVLAAATTPVIAQSDLEVVETFTLVGQGESRATNSITFDDLETKIPGLSLEKALDAVPGVNVRSTDPFGFYEFGNDIRVRSFDITRLAVTVDDVPMGNNSPRYGTPAGRVADPENMNSIKVSQGTGDVTTPAIEALGGSIMYYTRDPSKDMAAVVKWSMGSFDATRIFARFETGELWKGFTSYVSTSRFQFKSVGVPEHSRSIRFEAKAKQEFENGSFTLSYTWNDRDDFDTTSIQWDRWRALETGNPFAGYDPIIYNDAAKRQLEELAAGGYKEYSPYNSNLPAFLLGDYSDRGRNFGPPTYLDPLTNQGDGVNARYFQKWRNGRMDHFIRGRLELDLSDKMKVLATPYYQDKNNYGLFPVSRGDSRTQIQNAYRFTNTNSAGVVVPTTARDDIWPVYLFHDGAGNIVPIGTPGALPVGYNDVNGDTFYSTGPTAALSDTLNFAATPAPFSPGHALAVRGGTAPALNGFTARDEDFGGKRYGMAARVEYEFSNHKLRIGGWAERDEQSAYRPTYMVEGDSTFGDFLYDRVLFLNYDRKFKTDSITFYIDDTISFMEDRLQLNLGVKLVNFKRSVSGALTTPMWWFARTQTNSGTYKDNFLPQVGVTYALTPKIELFASYAESLAALGYDVIASDTFSSALKPERTSNYDIGLRFSGRSFSSTFAVFYNDYQDRILSVPLTQEELVAAGLSGVTGATNFRTVGGIEAYGAEYAFDWKTPVRGLRLSGSIAYQRGEFAEDLEVGYASFHENEDDPRSKFYEPIINADGTKTRSIEKQKGKKQGNTPDFTFGLDARYDIGNLGLTMGGKFYDSVFVNTLNTEKVDSYTLFNAAVTYKFEETSPVGPLKLILSIDNLFDQEIFYAGTYTGSFNGNVRADYGRNVTFTIEANF